MRALVERATRRLSFRRRLPPEFGSVPVHVSPAAGLRYLTMRLGRIDPPLLAAASALVKPGMTVWDVGANLGLFAFAAAAKAGGAGAVFAFEPDLWLVALLRRSASLQPPSSAPVRVLPVAVGANLAFRDFAIGRRSRAANALAEYGRAQMGGIAETVSVPTISLDLCLGLLPAPHLVKVDVEGAELEVLAGAERLLAEARPSILVEVGAEAADGVTAHLKGAGYALFDAEKPLARPTEIKRAEWATLAIPEERAARDG